MSVNEYTDPLALGNLSAALTTQHYSGLGEYYSIFKKTARMAYWWGVSERLLWAIWTKKRQVQFFAPVQPCSHAIISTILLHSYGICHIFTAPVSLFIWINLSSLSSFFLIHSSVLSNMNSLTSHFQLLSIFCFPFFPRLSPSLLIHHKNIHLMESFLSIIEF